MKKLLITFLTLLILIFTSEKSFGQNDVLSGTWKGTFMGQFQVVIEFTQDASGVYSGTLKMNDGPQQIQNDQLSQIDLSANKISFFIHEKNTPYKGEISGSSDSIMGKFIFPDGSTHPLSVAKTSLADLEEKEEIISPFITRIDGELLSADLYFLADQLKILHPDLFEFVDATAFEKLTKQTIENLGENQTQTSFLLLASSLTNAVGCSHTGVRLPEESRQLVKQQGNYLPARLFFENKRAYLVSSIDPNIPIQPGAEILSVNGSPIEEIIEKVFEFIPAEGNNTTTKYFEINKNFADYFVLIDNSEIFEMVYKNGIGKKALTTLESTTYDKLSTLFKFNRHNPDVAFPISYTLLDQKKTALMTIPTFGIQDINYYIHFMDSIFILARENKLENLIIDFRGNSGGHPIFAAQLFSYLTDTNFIYFNPAERVEELAPLYTSLPPNPMSFSGKSIALVDGGCLSTTGHLISLLKYHHSSTIIGEEPGSSYRCNDMSQQVSLPNSGLVVNIPTKVFQTEVSGFTRQSSMLDIQTNVDIEDVLQQNDPSMKKALELTANKKTVEL